MRALGLLIAAAAAGWFAADRLLTEVSVMVISTDHGPTPTLRPGETVAVQVETGADRFIYCYYMDNSRQVARIFPNRFQPDAFVPAGQKVQIPPGPETERPFNIRLDTAGQIEVITCLASSTELDRNRIDGTEIEDLTPIPGLGLQDLLDAFGNSPPPGLTARPFPSTSRRMRTASRVRARDDRRRRLAHSGIALAAVLHQEPEQRLEAIDIDAVDDGPPLPSGQHQPGVAQLGEVERQGRGCDAQPLRQHTRR